MAGEAPPRTPRPVSREAYPWLADRGLDVPGAVEPLSSRFGPPAGFARVGVEAGSFGAWLRELPLAAAGTPVLSYRGEVLRNGEHRYVAAVVAIDVGKADLQQCADSVMRLHAEWLWSKGRRDMSYRAAAGVELPFSRWSRGERVFAEGNRLSWAPSGKPSSDDHGSFRAYLDVVFNWANTVSLAKQAKPVGIEQLRPGDFVVLPGGPGHAVLVVDLARAADGRLVALLGQGFMPAQNFHILRGDDGSPWFAIDPGKGAVQTPFWPEPFPWSSLRRLDG